MIRATGKGGEEMKLYTLTAQYRMILEDRSDIEVEEFIDIFTEYFDADAWFASEFEVLRNTKAMSESIKEITLILRSVPMRGNVIEKQDATVLRTVTI
jgi:hypothetical protein